MNSLSFFAIISLISVAFAAENNIDIVRDYQYTSIACEECHVIASTFEKWIAENKTEVEIEQRLDEVCEILNKTKYSYICDKIVEIGVPEFIKLVEQFETPELLCKQLKLCSSIQCLCMTDMIDPIFYEDDKILCVGCHYIIDKIKLYSISASGEKEITEYAEKLCSLMPTYKNVCDDIMKYTIPKLLELLAKYEDSTVICKEIKACPIDHDEL